MWRELTQLSEGYSGRLLLALVLLIFLYMSAISDLLRGPESISWLILDLMAVIVIGLIIITTIWPHSGEILSQIDEEYGPYISLGISTMFFLWMFYLLMYDGEGIIFILISLGGGLLGFFDFLWSIFNEHKSSQLS